MKQHRLTIALGLIAASSILNALSKVLQQGDILFWLCLLCCLVSLVLSIQELVEHFSKKNRTAP